MKISNLAIDFVSDLTDKLSQIGNDYDLTMIDQLPITNYQLPITYYPLPITNYQLPITHYQLPITHYLLPITYYPLPITNSDL